MAPTFRIQVCMHLYVCVYTSAQCYSGITVSISPGSVGYILNVTREIDNFYPEVFKYLNIRLATLVSHNCCTVFLAAW